ncbi:LysR family transcriptional regulator [Phreatobacter cathodiphilus]|jgi:DNA-binding transcriptional LysR family regulator|uniref:LysR family transcriptional regulator n=1 Tax=Phreatobacter cathodiphilus TaxID=1868589 RepID=A0A2S0NA43_9HYPH|nr:LysR family transcriptional regulator [Phreatobacter cathodiphilus]AVO44801.1 LysR family transcriptional regulator [Phreatobacter cathodiphilus]
MDWDKLRIFHAAAAAGSFTHAADTLGLSQSAVSRQVSSLEQDLKVPLFHRHARGLVLTEQGELLYHTAQDVLMKLESAKIKLTDSKERPNGELKVTTTVGLGTAWLAPRLGEFLELYPDIQIKMILTDEELDLSMREADVGIRVRQPVQPDLIQRKLFQIKFHAFASSDYLKRHGSPKSATELDGHRILAFGGRAPNYMQNVTWLSTAGRNGMAPRSFAMTINNISGLVAAVENGIGIAVLPDYLIRDGSGLVQILDDEEMPVLDAWFVYPEELKSVARVQVFRDFLVSKASRWPA